MKLVSLGFATSETKAQAFDDFDNLAPAINPATGDVYRVNS